MMGMPIQISSVRPRNANTAKAHVARVRFMGLIAPHIRASDAALEDDDLVATMLERYVRSRNIRETMRAAQEA